MGDASSALVIEGTVFGPRPAGRQMVGIDPAAAYRIESGVRLLPPAGRHDRRSASSPAAAGAGMTCGLPGGGERGDRRETVVWCGLYCLLDHGGEPGWPAEGSGVFGQPGGEVP